MDAADVREIALVELADEFGLSDSTVSERLRRALATILGKTVAADSPGRGAGTGGDG